MEAITTAVGTAMSTVQTNAMTMISDAVPYALGIAGVVIAVRLGWRVFKSLSK